MAIKGVLLLLLLLLLLGFLTVLVWHTKTSDLHLSTTDKCSDTAKETVAQLLSAFSAVLLSNSFCCQMLCWCAHMIISCA